MDEFEKRKDDRPDQFTLAWWRKQLDELRRGYRGATHSVNLAHDNHAQTLAEIRGLSERCDTLEKELQEANSRVGELQAELSEVRTKQEAMGNWLKEKLSKTRE